MYPVLRKKHLEDTLIMVEEENHTHNFFHPVKKEITSFNLRPNDKIWAVTKLKAFADDNMMLLTC